MVKYGLIDTAHVYRKSVASADATGVTFVVARQMFVFEMGQDELRRLARQIDDALMQSAASSRQPKA